MLLLGLLLGAGLVRDPPGAGRPGAPADLAVVRWLAGHRTGARVDTCRPGAADLGATILVFVLGFVAAAAALAALRRWWPVLLLVIALVGELALFLTTAVIIDRPRPPVTHLDAALPPTSSFPSGHTGAAICLYGGVAAIIFVSTRAWWRWIVVAAAAVLVVAIAGARLYRGAHFPTDVLGSVLLAVPWLLICLRVLRPDDPPIRGDSPDSRAALAGTGAVGRGSARGAAVRGAPQRAGESASQVVVNLALNPAGEPQSSAALRPGAVDVSEQPDRPTSG